LTLPTACALKRRASIGGMHNSCHQRNAGGIHDNKYISKLTNETIDYSIEARTIGGVG